MSKGIRGYIKSRIPQPWEYILKKNRKYTEFVEKVYKVCAYSPNNKRMHVSNTMHNAQRIMCRAFIVIVQLPIFANNYLTWRDINTQIQEYELNCK